MSRDYDATIHIDIDGISIGDVPLCAAYEAHDIALKYIGEAKTATNIARARDEVARLARKYRMFMPVYMGKPFKEENNMNIPGKLREDLKRIYGAADPLNYIEDICVDAGPGDTEVRLTLRVPMNCERFAKSSPHYGPGVYMRHALGDFGIDFGCVCAAPEPKRNTIDFPEPKQVFFNGNHTTIVWPDGEKTIVGLGPDTQYDEYAGFCAAIVKKLFGSSREAQKFLDKVKVVQKNKDKKKKQAEPELVPMPGTTDPDWGEKHWGATVAAEVPHDAE